jgi:hypothetical protein
MKRILFGAVLLLCLWVNTARSQQPAPDTDTRTITIDIKVIETASRNIEEIDKLVKDKPRLTQMLANNSAKLVVNTQIITISDRSNFLRLGQRVPVQRTGGSGTQIQHESTGLNIEVHPRLVSGNLIEVSLKLEMNGVIGDTNPSAIQRSFTNIVMLKAGETSMPMGFTQNDTLWPRSLEQGKADDAIRGNFFVLVTAKVTN